MAIFSYTPKVEEVIVSREQTAVRVRTYLPAISSDREAILGRVFGFIEINIPRTPQLDELLSAVDRELVQIYGQGSLRPGENAEAYFENALRRVEKRIGSVVAERRIKLDQSNINAVFGMIVGTDIHLSAHGRVCAYLIRRTAGKPAKVVDILSGLDGETDRDERLLSTVIYGKMDANDAIIITNDTMAQAVPVADFVQNTREADPAALGSHLRSLASLTRPAAPAVGIIIRLSVSRLETKTENTSVDKMISTEEEVARVLEPSGIPALQNVFGKIRNKNEQPGDPVPPRSRLPKRSSGNGSLEGLNRLPRRAKVSLLVAITLFGVFFLSAEIMSWRKGRDLAATAYAAQVKQVNDLADEAESSVIYDETRSNSLLADAEAKLAALPDKTKAQKDDHAALAARLAALSRRLNNIYDAKPAPVATVGGAPTTLNADGGDLYSASGNSLFRVRDGKAQSIATFPAAPVWSAVNAGTLFFMLGNGTLVSVDPKNQIPTAVTYGGPASPRSGGFWNGRLYVAAADGLQIFKLNPTALGYEGSTPWLKNQLSGKGVAAIALDGTIFAAVPGDAVRDFIKGVATPYNAAGASALTDPKALYAGASDLYLLGGDGTIAEWDNKGKLLAQFVIPADAGKATAFTVDEASKNVYFTTDKGNLMMFSIAK
jgi:hypothetical protein